MNYLNDRQRVERALVPGMLLQAILAMTAEPGQEQAEGFAEITEALNNAVREFAEDLDAGRRRKIATRCRRLTQGAFEHCEFYATDKRQGAAAGKVVLAVMVWLKDLIDRDVAVGDCDFVRAYEAIAEALAAHEEAMRPMERSAVRAAEKMRQFFEREGYFTNAAMAA